MPEETTAVAESNVKETPTETTRDAKDEQIANLMKAVDAERIQRKEVSKKLDTLKSAQLEEQGKYKELYETGKTELEAMKSQLTGYEAHFTAAVEAAKVDAPQEMIELLPSNLSSQDQLTWITKATAAFNPKNAEPSPRKTVPPGMINPSSTDTRVSVTDEEFKNMDAIERIKHLDGMGYSKETLKGY